MSQRGRKLFDKYVREVLKHPTLAGIGIQSHVHNLLHEAKSARIPISEIEEEVGPLVQAVSAAKFQDEVNQLYPLDQKDNDTPPT
jgi:hypothetical protein